MSDIRDGSLFRQFTDIYICQLEDETLYDLLIDYWIHHHPTSNSFWWFKRYVSQVEKYIQKRWSDSLPNMEIVLQKIREKDEDPLDFKENSENLF